MEVLVVMASKFFLHLDQDHLQDHLHNLHHLDHLQARKLNLPVLLNRVHKHQDLNQLLSDPSNNLDLIMQLFKKMLLQQNGFIQVHGIGIELDSILLASITHALEDNILYIFQQPAISIYI